jgi:hypothetical protein
MSSLIKCLWVTLQSLNLTQDGLDHCRAELNRVTREFVQEQGVEILTLQEREDQEAFNEQGA